MRYYSGSVTLSSDYQKLDFGGKAGTVKIKTSNSIDFSFNGNAQHGKVLAAEGVQTFERVGASEIYVKGTGTAEVTAWEDQ